jgi:hypothetical protein
MNGEKTTGWVIGNSKWQPFFWIKLFNDIGFRDKLKIRWNELRKDKLSNENILSFIDLCANYLEEAQERNFEKWPILGVFLWRETEGYQNRDTYQKEIDYLKNYMIERTEWMDDQLKIDPAYINSNVNKLPENYSLDQNYPNPFNPITTIKYSIPKPSFVTLNIYDFLGREITSLVNEEQPGGVYTIQFSAEGRSLSNGNVYNLSSGVYFYRLTAGNYFYTRKFIILK